VDLEPVFLHDGSPGTHDVIVTLLSDMWDTPVGPARVKAKQRSCKYCIIEIITATLSVSLDCVTRRPDSSLASHFQVMAQACRVRSEMASPRFESLPENRQQTSAVLYAVFSYGRRTDEGFVHLHRMHLKCEKFRGVRNS
jgi:hypothetical protein